MGMTIGATDARGDPPTEAPVTLPIGTAIAAAAICQVTQAIGSQDRIGVIVTPPIPPGLGGLFMEKVRIHANENSF